MAATPRTRLCLVTPPAFAPAAFASVLASTLDAGDVAAVRLRIPGLDAGERVAALRVIRPVIQSRGVALVLDGDVELARREGCDGVHLEPSALAAARSGRESLALGVACGASYHAAMEAAEDDADYVWFDAAKLDDETLESWAAAMLVPCIVGGGIAIEDVATWAVRGADFVALGRAIWAAGEHAPERLRLAAQRLAAARRIVEGPRSPC